MGKGAQKFVLSAPVVISLLLTAVHFVRDRLPWFAAVYLLLLVVFLSFREPVVARAIQAALIIAACEWLRTTFVLASLRMQEGGTWIRLVVILLGVAGFVFASVFTFRAKSLKELYGLSVESKPEN